MCWFEVVGTREKRHRTDSVEPIFPEVTGYECDGAEGAGIAEPSSAAKHHNAGKIPELPGGAVLCSLEEWLRSPPRFFSMAASG